MATYTQLQKQSTGENYLYTVDFTNDLPSGGTITAGTATHLPPSGAVSSIVSEVDSPYIYIEVPTQTVTGVHYVDVLATINNDEANQASVRIPIQILYPSPVARPGMADIITELRELTDSSPDDYTIAGVPYWTDAQLQRILDNHRTDIKWYEMIAQEEGDLTYYDYSIGYGNLEQTTGGTAVFIVQDLSGNAVNSALYTVDYARGVVSFLSDTGGTDYWITARSYDLISAAAEVWHKKQGHYHTAISFSTDNHNISRNQLYEHAKEMTKYFENQAGGGVGVLSHYRPDTDD